MSKNPHFTYTEIMQQPRMWLEEYELLRKNAAAIEAFVSRYLEEGYEIIYTGAGTSAFIGNILETALAGTRFRGGRAVPTTDIITNPKAYFSPDSKVLLISFARSGNSPESLGTIEIANTICREVAHIYITCNAEGKLAKAAGSDNTLLLLLPPQTNDRSLAMTSSFSTMLFTCMMLAVMPDMEKLSPAIHSLAERSARALVRYDEPVSDVASLKFDRAVFLGSGELKGIAEESRLKLQELTDGRVVCNFDSFLGFRHGPQAVVNDKSILIYLFSEDPFIRKYEIDLVRQINRNNDVVAQVAVSAEKVDIPGVNFTLEMILGGKSEGTGMFDCMPYVFAAQLLGYYKSLDMGLNPDTPSVSGNISRVVEGVTIYS